MGFKDLEAKTQRLIIGCTLAGVIVTGVAGFDALNSYFVHKSKPEAITKDINHNGKPEVYVEINGDKYFSIYDGEKVNK